jgi:hypothetical protein
MAYTLLFFCNFLEAHLELEQFQRPKMLVWASLVHTSPHTGGKATLFYGKDLKPTGCP